MKPIRIFFATITVMPLAFLVSTFVPHSAKANPKQLATGEYPEAEGARCADIKYGNKSI